MGYALFLINHFFFFMGVFYCLFVTILLLE